MRSAHLEVVLLTDEALKSEYILGKELPFLALEDGAEVQRLFGHRVEVRCVACYMRGADRYLCLFGLEGGRA